MNSLFALPMFWGLAVALGSTGMPNFGQTTLRTRPTHKANWQDWLNTHEKAFCYYC